LDATHFLCAYAGESDEGTAVVLEISKPLKKVALVNSLVFDSNLGMYTSLSKIDDTHFLCAYTGQSGKGRAVIISVDPADWSINKEFDFTFDFVRGLTPALFRIDARHHLCVYGGAFGRGMAVVLTVDTDNWDIEREVPTIFEAVFCISPAICQIDSNRYLCAYAGPSSIGKGVVLNVNSFAWSVSTLSRFVFDADVGLFPDLRRIESDRYLCVYQGKNSDAWANVLNVDLSTAKVTPAIQVEYDPIGGRAPALAQVNENHFLCVYQGANNDGWAVVINTDPPVLP
jgi:hypothetical protein